MIQLTRQSSNIKLTGKKKVKFASSMRQVGTTCPSTCNFLKSGTCYALGGATAIHQRKATPSSVDGTNLVEFVKTLAPNTIMRHHVSGDFFKNGDIKEGSNEFDEEYFEYVLDAAKIRPDITFYTYTHDYTKIDLSKYEIPKNLLINASCDTVEQVQDARSKGWNTTLTVGMDFEGKRQGNFVVCPAQTSELSCAECKLCMKDRKFTVLFKAHGFGAKKLTRQLQIELPLA